MFAAFSSSFITTPGMTRRIQFTLSLYGRTWMRENSSRRCSPRIEAYRMFVHAQEQVLVLREPLRRRRESDRCDEAGAEEGGIQPVPVFRGVFEHLDPECGRGAEDLDERELLLRAAGAEGRDRDPVDPALDRPERELHRREFRDLSLLEELAEAHVNPRRGAGPPSISCRMLGCPRTSARGSRTRSACRSSWPWTAPRPPSHPHRSSSG